MKKVLSRLLVLACFMAMTIVSCKKSEKEPPPVPEARTEKTVLLGEFTPYRVDTGTSKVTIGFVQSARLFQLSLDTDKRKAYLNLLRSALEKDMPVRVMIYEGTSNISEISSASRTGLRAYQAAKATKEVDARQTLPIIPNRTVLNKLFNACRFDASIPFQYATDGCYARAHRMRQIITAAGYDCAKFFVYGDLAANTGSCCVLWGYHVAPLVRFRDHRGNIRFRIIDPSLFTAPVDQGTWLKKCRDTYCDAGAGISSVSLQPGNVYVRVASGATLYDDDYSRTNCTLSAFAGLSGCAETGDNSMCW